jgi:hypothetical protein
MLSVGVVSADVKPGSARTLCEIALEGKGCNFVKGSAGRKAEGLSRAGIAQDDRGGGVWSG